jgi:hypothetical protein
VPSCVVASCDEELNVNVVLPPLCCLSLPVGDFLVVSNDSSYEFLVPQFLGAALAAPACRSELLTMTQSSFSNLQASQRLQVNVFEGSGGKLPYCNDTCTTLSLTQMNLFLTTACAPFCPAQ